MFIQIYKLVYLPKNSVGYIFQVSKLNYVQIKFKFEKLQKPNIV